MTTIKEEILISLYSSFFYLVNPYELFKGNEEYHLNSFYKAIARLEKTGLVRKLRKEKKIYLKLTEAGKKAVRKHRKAAKYSRRPWDAKWRVVIFDVPEKRAETRGHLMNYLKNLGFGMVQRSTWISPYDFGKLIERFVRKMKLSDCVYHLTVSDFQSRNNLELAQTFWPLKKINAEYRKLIIAYSARLKRFQQNKQKNNGSSPSDGTFLLNSLVWDYQTISAHDPHLPEELLPPKWGQQEAQKLIQRIKRNFALN